MGKWQLVTFDCYGTLIDWDSGIRAFFEKLLKEKGSEVDLAEFHCRWEAIQFEWLKKPYQSYKDILKVSLRDALQEQGLPYSEDDGTRFAAAMPTWQPFPDVQPALTELKQHAKLAIISNTDNDILAESVRLMGVDFDALITAEDVKVYKPSPLIFEQALERLAVRPEHVLHVAFGFKYDLATAKSVGMTTCWLNRTGQPRPPAITPDFEASDLCGVVKLMTESGRHGGS